MRGLLSLTALTVVLLVHSSQAVYVQVSALLFHLLVLQVLKALIDSRVWLREEPWPELRDLICPSLRLGI